MLSEYVADIRDLLNDTSGQLIAPERLHRYINKARRRICAVSGCLRVVPPGASTHPGQEIYPFSDWISLVQGVMPGIESILAVRSLAIAIGINGWKPQWQRTIWTDFQARFRVWNSTFYGTVSEPGWYAQYGVGANGALYLAPIPSQHNLMEPDLTLIPQPLLTDDDPEIIPYPWDDSVCYWAATLALLGAQRREDAQAMALLFNTDLPMCAAVVCPQLIQTSYRAVIRSA